MTEQEEALEREIKALTKLCAYSPIELFATEIYDLLCYPRFFHFCAFAYASCFTVVFNLELWRWLNQSNRTVCGTVRPDPWTPILITMSLTALLVFYGWAYQLRKELEAWSALSGLLAVALSVVVSGYCALSFT